MHWWQTRDLVLIPIAAILGLSLIVGVQGREIKALKARVDALEERQAKEDEFRDVVPPSWHGWKGDFTDPSCYLPEEPRRGA